MAIVKKIFETFFMLLGLLMCGIGFVLLIPQIVADPTDVPCYVGVIFLATVTVFILFFIYLALNLPLPAGKPKPKTFSKYLVIWFVIVLYVCGLGAALLWWGVTVAESWHGLFFAFAIIFTILGVGALGGLVWQVVIGLKNKYVLQHGIETEATFVDCYPTFSFHTGKDIGGTTIFQYCVKFKYLVGEKEVIGKTHSLYSQTEANNFQQMNKFLVKYQGQRAVIAQLPQEINRND